MPVKSSKPTKLEVKISSLKIKKKKKIKEPVRPLPPVSPEKSAKRVKIVKPPIIELPKTEKPEIETPAKKPKPVKQPEKKVETKKPRKTKKKPVKTKPKLKPRKPEIDPPKPPAPPEAKMILAKTPPVKKKNKNHLQSFKSLYENLKNKHRKANQNSQTVEQQNTEQKKSSQASTKTSPPQLSGNERNLFLQKVSRILQRNKRYPSRARRRNITGKVNLVFKINQNGQPFDIKIDSQAHSLLIQAAERMINKSRFPTPPNGWETNFQISVPVNFNLK
jgi:protein TonB